MIYKRLGQSALKVSEISFGCMSLGNDDNVNARLLHAAVDAGINFFDTADLYARGENEITVGKALHARRDKVIIATKVGNQWRQDGSGWDWNPNKEYILQAVEQSLKRLQTDYIDLYQLHGGTVEDPIEDTIAAFEHLKAQGKIRAYGISSIRPNVIREYVKRSSMDSVMMQYSLLDRRAEETCFALLHDHNIGVLTRGSLAGGLLTGKPPKDYLLYTADEVKRAAQVVHDIAGQTHTSVQVALRFALDPEAVTTAVTGIRTEEQLRMAVEATQAPRLTSKEMEALRQSLPVNRYESHR
jgi:aryl-alcohol dehydrogenase-like predicted oxidoreductase